MTGPYKVKGPNVFDGDGNMIAQTPNRGIGATIALALHHIGRHVEVGEFNRQHALVAAGYDTEAAAASR